MGEDSSERRSKWQVTMGPNPMSHAVKLSAHVVANATVQAVVIPARFETKVISVVSSPPRIELPTIGESILSYLYPPEHLVGMLGDLEEGFHNRVAKHGLRAGRRWYLWQVTRSVLVCAFRLLRILVLIREALEKLGL
jgi:hypothetical protein